MLFHTPALMMSEARRRIQLPSCHAVAELPVIVRLIGCDVWVKHETIFPPAPSRLEAGLNMSQLSQERQRGVMLPNWKSWSIHRLCRQNLRSHHCVPQAANPTAESMMDFGGDLMVAILT
jgi:hypothetical protein